MGFVLPFVWGPYQVTPATQLLGRLRNAQNDNGER
jgi:hypothetical protein